MNGRSLPAAPSPLDPLAAPAAATSAEHRRQILRERAARLARPVELPAAPQGLPVTCFTIADVNYAVETACVSEVFLLDEITAIPGAPSFLAGVVNRSGLILALLDTKVILELPAFGITDIHAVVVLRSDTVMLGLLADRLLGSALVLLENLLPSPETGWRSPYLRGVTPEGTALLDAPGILADEMLLIGAAGTPGSALP